MPRHPNWRIHARWATFSPKDQPEIELTFVKANDKIKCKALGKQAGDHVFLTLQTDDYRKDYKNNES